MKYAFEEALTGQEIRELRTQLEMNREEFAAFCGVSKKTVEYWENSGKSISGNIRNTALIMKYRRGYCPFGFFTCFETGSARSSMWMSKNG